MEKAIITGADGFVGSYTANFFVDNDVEVLALDILDHPARIRESAFLKYKQVDVSQIDRLRQMITAGEYDTFVHFAWSGSAGSGRMDYNLQIKNAIDTVGCMKFAQEIGCTRFVCAGSIMEKEVEAVLHTQGSKPGMAYIYGMGKHTAHCLCKAVAADIGIDLIWPMITNAYGEGERSPRFVNTTIRKIMANEPLQFTAATQNYDFVHVADVAKAFYMIAKNGKPFCEYMIGSGNARPLKEFILEMVGALTPHITPVFGDIPFTGVNMPLSVFDTGRTAEDCGFRPSISFAEGTRRTMEWLQKVS